MIDPKYSRPIDVHRWSDHPEINSLVDTIWQQDFRDFKPKSTGPKPKSRLKDQLKVVLLDLYIAWASDPELSIGVSMSVNSWKVGSRYNALHLSKVIIDIIHRLHELQLIELSAGSYAGPGAKTNRNTRIKAAPVLEEMFGWARWEFEDIGTAPDRETVILRSDDGLGGSAKPIKYEDTRETLEMRAFLEEYNRCISNHFIDMPELDRPFIERTISDGPRAGGTQRIPIGPSNSFVRRVFSRGEWGLNGRFYGGWWQQIDQGLRSTIFIDDLPTVEADFQGLHVAILSKEQGIRLEGDPYDLPKGLIDGVSHHSQRNIVKRLILTVCVRSGCSDGA